MPDTPKRWTPAEVRALPDDGNRYELIDGELIVSWGPDPRWLHEVVMRDLAVLLHSLLQPLPAFGVLWSSTSRAIAGDDAFKPDLFVYRSPTGRAPLDWSEATDVRLVVEVPTPDTAHDDAVIKRERYQRIGIPEYWMLMVDARMIRRWNAGQDRPEDLSDRMTWRPDPNGPEVEIDLEAFYSKVYGER